MRPPICAVCGKTFRPKIQGDLVYFLVRKKQETFTDSLNRLFSIIKHKLGIREPAICGHPENAEWFCKKHLKSAQKIAHDNSIEEGIPLLKNL